MRKGVYFKNTRHGGGTTRSNYMKEMFDWFFRHSFGRCHAIERAQKSSLAKEVRRQSRLNAKEKWTNSSGPLIMLGGVKLVIEWASVGYPPACKTNDAMQCKVYVCKCVCVELLCKTKFIFVSVSYCVGCNISPFHPFFVFSIISGLIKCEEA